MESVSKSIRRTSAATPFSGVSHPAVLRTPPSTTITTAGALAASLAAGLGRTPQLIGDANRPVRRIGWCSGGAQGYFEQAIALGLDAYVSGEISEQTVHLARESGVAYLAAGHHATERFGAAALAAHLAQHCQLDCEFVDIDNPV